MSTKPLIPNADLASISLDKYLSAFGAKAIPEVIEDTDYAAAVDTLLTLAINHTGSGAVTAAQVLLSTYNSYHYHLDVTDLCYLDPTHYRAAMIVIRGRVELKREPHELIGDGDKRFRRLENLWQELHVDRRYAKRYANGPRVRL